MFFSVDRAINSYINIYLERKVFSLYQFSFVFSSTHWLQKNIPLFLQFSNWRGKGTPCYFANINPHSLQWWSCDQLSHVAEGCGAVVVVLLLQLCSSQLAHISKGPSHLPKTSYKTPATVCFQAESVDCIDTYCVYLL